MKPRIGASVTELAAGVGVAAVGAWFVWLSLAFDLQVRFGRPGPGFLPLWLSISLAVCGLLLALRSRVTTVSIDAESDSIGVMHRVKALAVLGLLALLAASQVLLGFLPGSVLFLFVTLSVVERVPIIRAAIVSILTTAGLYAVFNTLLQVHLPSGLLLR